MARATRLNEAISTLQLPYTYTLLRDIPLEKVELRKKMGAMNVDLLEKMRDELLDKAWDQYKLWKEL